MITKTPDAWRAAVAAGTTQAGYWDWEPTSPESTELRPFLVEFSRDVTTIDTFSRVIMARSYAETNQIANQIAEESDLWCPDDAENSGGESYGSWFNTDVNCTPSAAELDGVPVHA